ncbi:MFS transporter [Caulobacter segnis]|uniref:MFS transporter n=1 Tax=Caulobacter segnis TaxID=88688 RepID=UPI001CBD8DB5|nr:MFS transporter [Caulobacter segnis]UAL10185.1 MFS transporter [Caulobacter segnis]
MSESSYVYADHERPAFPGSPFSPVHSGGRRLAYGLAALVLAVVATLGNGLVNVNVANLSGSMGVYAAQASWLPAIYVAMNATANLTLVKARAQFGIPQVTSVLIVGYVLASAWQLLFPGFLAAGLVRATSGMMAAGLTTLTIYNLIQVFPPKLKPLGVVIGIGLIQLGMPLARLFPVEMLALDNWRGLHLIEMGLGLTAFVALHAVRLPPSERSKAFEPLDFLTIGLVVPAALLICGVLSEGRLLWWTDTPWLGVALATGLGLLALAAAIEVLRARPLMQLRWLGALDIIRFAAVAMLVRIALAEQTFGAVGLLTAGGLNNDQLHILFSGVVAAMLLGTVVAAVTLSATRLPYQVMVAALIIAAGAWWDAHATNLTRPEQLYGSQALLAFGTTLFIGPALLYGLTKMLAKGADHLVTFIVLFSTTQNVGGLVGSAFLGTYQTIAAREHAASLAERVVATDPQVMARIQAGARTVSSAVVDPAAQAAQGVALLGQALSREAAILAFNDVFRLVAILALLTAAYVAYVIVFNTLRRRSQAARETSS